MDIKKEYERWLENATADANVAAELKTLDNAKIEDDDQTMKIEFNCEDVIRRALEKYGA